MGKVASYCKSGLRWTSPRPFHDAKSYGQRVNMLDGHCLSLNGSLTFSIGVDGLLIAKETAKCDFRGREV